MSHCAGPLALLARLGHDHPLHTTLGLTQKLSVVNTIISARVHLRCFLEHRVPLHYNFAQSIF